MWSIGGIHSIPVIADSLASLSKLRDTKVLKYEVVTLPRQLNRFNDRVLHRPVFQALEACSGIVEVRATVNSMISG